MLTIITILQNHLSPVAGESPALLIFLPEPGYPLYIRARPYVRRVCMYVSNFARSMPHNPTGRASYVGWIEVQKARRRSKVQGTRKN